MATSTISHEVINRLEKKAIDMRLNLLEMLPAKKVGHLGGSSSATDIITTLYFHIMKIDQNNPHNPKRDFFLMSKGHAVLAQYAALGELGFFSKEEFAHLKTLGGLLQGHPDMKTPGIEAVTGSLGQGLSLAAGLAYGLKLDNKENNVYVMCGDGEMAEGQLWEAASFSAHYELSHLTMILDRNSLQASGTCKEVMNIPNLAQKWEAFGWHVIEVDGHDIPQLIDAFDVKTTNKPKAIIADTIKGKGFAFAENVVAFHNGSMTKEQYVQGLNALKKQKETTL